MRCRQCEERIACREMRQPDRSGRSEMRPRSVERPRLAICACCGAVLLTLDGVEIAVDTNTQVRLARFGLGNTVGPLLEPRREGT